MSATARRESQYREAAADVDGLADERRLQGPALAVDALRVDDEEAHAEPPRAPQAGRRAVEHGLRLTRERELGGSA